MKHFQIFDLHPSGKVMKRTAKIIGNDALPDLTITTEAGASFQDVAERLRRMAAIFDRQQG